MTKHVERIPSTELCALMSCICNCNLPQVSVESQKMFFPPLFHNRTSGVRFCYIRLQSNFDKDQIQISPPVWTPNSDILLTALPVWMEGKEVCRYVCVCWVCPNLEWWANESTNDSGIQYSFNQDYVILDHIVCVNRRKQIRMFVSFGYKCIICLILSGDKWMLSDKVVWMCWRPGDRVGTWLTLPYSGKFYEDFNFAFHELTLTRENLFRHFLILG